MKHDLKKIKDSVLEELYSSYDGIADLLILEPPFADNFENCKISVEIVFYRQSYLALLDECEDRDSLDWDINKKVRSLLKYMGIEKTQIESVEILTMEDMDKSSVGMIVSFDDVVTFGKNFLTEPPPTPS